MTIIIIIIIIVVVTIIIIIIGKRIARWNYSAVEQRNSKISFLHFDLEPP